MLKLQDMAEISHNQLHSVLAQQQARDREVKSLRQQVREFQVQTDEHALIGEIQVMLSIVIYCFYADRKTRL